MRSPSGLDPQDVAAMIDGLAPLAPGLAGARMLVTGASGWFGTWLLDGLITLNRRHGLELSIVALCRDPPSFAVRQPALYAAPELAWVAADVRAPLPDRFGRLTHVIHAANDSVVRAGAAPVHETIVSGTTNVLRLVTGHPEAKVLLVSSGAVYGPGSGCFSEESNPTSTDRLDDYARGKRRAEALASDMVATRGLRVTIARCFAFVGPHMPLDAHFAIGNFIRDALDGSEVVIAGDGTPRRSYLYMTDLVTWLLTILCQGRAGRAYNVGGVEPVSIAALARRCVAVVGRQIPVRVAQQASGGRDYLPDVTRVRTELGLDVRVELDDAIERTARWTRRMQTA